MENSGSRQLVGRGLIFLVLIFMILPVRLCPAEEQVNLEEVVVTATRTEEETDRIPANVTVITKEDIKKSTAKTVQDILRDEEGLLVRDLYGTGTKSNVDMRGFDRGINTAILIDGRKVNEIDLSGVDWNLIPLENVERIEIVRGSGSVLYGDNAMAGVINIITKKGKSIKPEMEFNAEGESYNGNKEFFSLGGTVERLGYFVFARRRDTDGYRDNSSFNATDLQSSFTVNLSSNAYIDLRAGRHEDSQGLPGGLTEDELKDDRRQTTHPDDKVDYDQYFYGGDIVYSLGWADLEAGYNFNSREFNSILAGDFFGSTYTSDTTRTTNTNDAKIKLTARKNLLNHKNLFVAGLDYSNSRVRDKNLFDFFGIYTTKTNLRKRETGIYFEDEFYITEKLVFIGGYRYTTAKFDDRIATDFSSGSGGMKARGGALKAGVSYNYSAGAKVFANYSRGFRLPTTDELFAFDGTSVTVSHLKPEIADTYEAGVVHPFTKNIVARLTLYYMNVKDELFLNPTSGFFGTNENIDRTRHQGIEIGFNAGLTDAVSIFGNGTYSEVTFESGQFEGKTIPLRPRYSANLGTDVKLSNPILLTVKGNWVGKRYLENDVENSKDKLPDYFTVDAKLTYKYKSLTAYIGVNNIFDRKYSEYGAFGWTSGNILYYPAPGRNYYAGISIAI